MSKSPRLIQNQSAFATIEVLISIILLSIGIIALMKLQISAVQASQQSNFYSNALSLANEMADQMAGNREQLSSPDTSPFLHVDYRSGQHRTGSSQSCFDADCGPAQLAAAEIDDWINKISNALPNARAKICLDDAPWDDSKNSLKWPCASSGNHSSIVIKLGWEDKREAREEAPPFIAMPVMSHAE